jgi:hypothetical protein
MTTLVVFACDERKCLGAACGRFARRTVQHSVQQFFVTSYFRCSVGLCSWGASQPASPCARDAFRITRGVRASWISILQYIIMHVISATVTIVLNYSACREKKNVTRNLSCVTSGCVNIVLSQPTNITVQSQTYDQLRGIHAIPLAEGTRTIAF